MILTIEILILIVSIFIYFFITKKDLHIFQLEEYKIKDYTNWIIRNKTKYIYNILIFLVTIITVFLNNKFNIINNYVFSYISIFIILTTYLYMLNISRKQAHKKTIKITSRLKRIYLIDMLLFITQIILVYYLINKDTGFLILVILSIISVINILISNLILLPLQILINKRYINDAKRILEKRTDLIKIGITGSYGKTSSKFILESILSRKYSVLVTPNSFNTPLGNVITIREHLKNHHEIYISEMGAKKVGEIKEICDIIKPKYGIITSIGKQHLDTFKNIDNIIKTKYELIDSLPADGVAFMPLDNKYTKAIYLKEKRKKYSYGIFNEKDNLDVWVKNIELSEKGSTFSVHKGEESIDCTTCLLGEHNVINILGCISIAIELGLTLDQIKIGVSKIKPIEHRLQIISNNNGTIVLDDAFNSNPNGAKAALKVLSEFNGRKIIVTPGMIELGKEEQKLNKEFGNEMAKIVNIAILVGEKRTVPIKEGIEEYKENNTIIYVVNSLGEATKKLGEVVRRDDIILFENDLPDNYNE